ncbi:MAG: hypothetical protein M3450_10125 [Actinomycetota bacterium]|nr:hypothetical protein [Actinomycetota bacterium]
MTITNSTVPQPPVWLNLHAVIDEETCAKIDQLAGRIEAAIEDLSPVLDECYRTLRKVHDAMSAGQVTEDAAWDIVHDHSGATRLTHLLRLLGAHADGAAGENVVGYDVPWLAGARAELGLGER